MLPETPERSASSTVCLGNLGYRSSLGRKKRRGIAILPADLRKTVDLAILDGLGIVRVPPSSVSPPLAIAGWPLNHPETILRVC